MDPMGFFEPASSTAGRLTIRDGLGAGIRVAGTVLEGRLSVEDALGLANVHCKGSPAAWDQAEVDRFWAERDSVFG